MSRTTVPATTGSLDTRLLVTGMTHSDGQLFVRELNPVAAQSGFTPEQVRSCLRRMVAEGVYERIRGGRDALYRTTEIGQTILVEYHRRLVIAYRQDQGSAPWDGNWHLVAFAVPEARRDARDALRERVLALRGAPLQGGLYVSPHPWEDDIRSTAKQLGIEGSVNLVATATLEVGGVAEPTVIASRLWPLAEVASGYRAFAGTFGGVPGALEAVLRDGGSIDDTGIVPGALAMAEAWIRCSVVDPLLPPELLPRPWPGREARDVLLRSRKLALAVRRGPGGLALFSTFDDSLDESVDPPADDSAASRPHPSSAQETSP